MSSGARLKVLQAREKEFETCGYCPKLCRAKCPVSNAEPRETLTPWGMMSRSWGLLRGSSAAVPAQARPAFTCTGCFRCATACEHKNPVFESLSDARAAFVAEGLAPPAVADLLAREAQRQQELWNAIDALQTRVTGGQPGFALLIGCLYTRRLPEIAAEIVELAQALVGPVRLLRACCGAVSRFAGDQPGFEQTRTAFLRELAGARLLVADPGCAYALRQHEPLLLVERAAQALGRFQHGAADSGEARRYRYHDPCQLGRGLGYYAEPRAVLERVLGQPAGSFVESAEDAQCSGAGALLPSVFPELSRQMTRARLAEHEAAGGGTLITGCAASLLAFRRSGVDTLDWVTLAQRALRQPGNKHHG